MEAAHPTNRHLASPPCADGHRFGEAQSVGGGILRRSCGQCGLVSIDLTNTAPPAANSLFIRRPTLPPARPAS